MTKGRKKGRPQEECVCVWQRERERGSGMEETRWIDKRTPKDIHAPIVSHIHTHTHTCTNISHTSPRPLVSQTTISPHTCNWYARKWPGGYSAVHLSIAGNAWEHAWGHTKGSKGGLMPLQGAQVHEVGAAGVCHCDSGKVGRRMRVRV